MKRTRLILALLFITLYSFGQDCNLQKNIIGDATICLGQSTTITLENSDPSVSYQLREGIINVGSPVIGTGLDILFTVSPTANTTYNVIAGLCPDPYTDTVNILVNPTPDAIATPSSQTICSGSSTDIALSSAVSGTTYSWTVVQTNVSGASNGSGNSIAQVLTATSSATGSAVYTITPTANGCPGNPTIVTVTVQAATVGGAVTVSGVGVTPVVNSATVCYSEPGTGTLYLSGHVGTVLRWEKSSDGGITWATISGSSNLTSYNYSGLIVATIFRAVIQNSPCTILFSTGSMISVIPNVKPDPVIATPSTICAGDSSILTSESGYATSQGLATGGTFNSSNPVGWLVDGIKNQLNAGASNTNPGPFQLSATNGGTYSGITYTSDNKFVIANGPFDSKLETPEFSTLGLSTATLQFNHAFNLLAGAWVKIEISINGGAYSTLKTYNGAATRTPYNNFPLETIDLNTYIGQPKVRVRFNYHGVGASSWAIDNVKIPDAPVNLTTQWSWTDSLGTHTASTANITVTPIETTIYAVTSFLNGCASSGPSGTTYVTVKVNQRPTASIGPFQTICKNGSATFSVALTGVAPWSLTYSDGAITTTVNNINASPYVFIVNGLSADTTYTVTGLKDKNCTAIAQDFTGSAVVTVLNGSAGNWTGLVSTDWFDCLNWSGGLPTSVVNAVIPSGSPRMPIISISSPFAAAYNYIANARDLVVATGASLTMAAGSNLHISRDWKNSGSFIPGTGTVTFNGATLNQIQSINAGIKTNESFYNLVLNNSNGAKGISVVDGFQLTVANNLSLLNGDLRLTGEAQLVQLGTAANPAGGTGKLLRDQQGTKSSFHYNYWCSPVSPDNLNYTVGGVLRDGTDVTTNPFSPGVISFANAYNHADGPVTSPIRISNRWIHKYTQISTSYFSWERIGSTGSVKVGEGYIMKGTDGTASITSSQNYVFSGKPNNGNITLNIALNQMYLIGNPYPSAFDADEFIKDNIKDGAGRASSNVINGALYFWDHFGGTSHFLSEYVGGYATYTLMGGVVGISNDPMGNDNGALGTKVPKRYVPVGQGFFIDTRADADLVANNPNLSSPITGGAVVLKNSQRAFKTESPANSVFFRENRVEETSEDARPKIRLQYDSPSGLHRQLLIGADPNTTNMFDIGYDAPMIDVTGDDMYWNLSSEKIIIQAVPDFGENQIIPIGFRITNLGESTVKISSMENISDDQKIFLFDELTGIYHDLRSADLSITLQPGDYMDRFSLRFVNQALGNEENELNSGIQIFYSNNNDLLNIKNNLLDTRVNSVYVFNMLGQSVSGFKIGNEDQNNIQIPMKNLSQGTYIVKVVTSNGNRSKKIIMD